MGFNSGFKGLKFATNCCGVLIRSSNSSVSIVPGRQNNRGYILFGGKRPFFSPQLSTGAETQKFSYLIITDGLPFFLPEGKPIEA